MTGNENIYIKKREEMSKYLGYKNLSVCFCFGIQLAFSLLLFFFRKRLFFAFFPQFLMIVLVFSQSAPFWVVALLINVSVFDFVPFSQRLHSDFSYVHSVQEIRNN